MKSSVVVLLGIAAVVAARLLPGIHAQGMCERIRPLQIG